MKLNLRKQSGEVTGEWEVKFAVSEPGKGGQAVHDTVVAYMVNQRMGTACTKTAGDVAGTNKKPWRQKGTGRARAGSFQSPLWRGGGVVFGPQPREFRKKVNSKTRRLALRRALTERLKLGDVVLVEDLKVASPRTKDFLAILTGLGLGGCSVLICVAAGDRNLSLSSRNVPRVAVVSGDEVHTYQVLRYDKLLFSRTALEKVQQRLA
jgi:large subunit ribosomal protein L4